MSKPGWREKYLAWKGARMALLFFCLILVFGIWLKAGCYFKEKADSVNIVK